MEALVAIGLAGNVVQFVQGAGALISLAKEIRDNGSPKSLPQLKKLSQTLTDHSAVLQSRLQASTPLTEENQNLLDLAIECQQAGNKFLAYLGTLTSSSTSKVVGAVKTAVKYQWSSYKISDFVSRLDRLRSSLILATVLACRSSTEDSNKEILTHLKEIQHDHQARDVYDQIGVVQAAIELLTNAVQNQTSEKLDAIQNGIQLCMGGVLALHQEVLTDEETRGREREILDWIDFRQNHWRYEGVDQAYQRTYEWLFETSINYEYRDSFSAHLKEDANEPYFINGKPGSGKSTLMKFIYGHATTRECLKQWAGSKELVMLQYFFWNLGTTMQKTQTGMLRGLLHAVLEKHPELIPAVFPKLYRSRDTWEARSGPEFIELKKAFEIMMEKSPYLKMAIFIDGIDEFEGDHRDMALFLRSLVSHRVKLVISSRPLNACLASLGGCPTLRVQDLTRKDMETFVYGELSTHHLMTRLVRQFPARGPLFASEVVNKSEGVFLWVKLVVRVLIQGLENGDNLDELQTKLTTLPSDLRDLYKRIFAKMDMEYQKESAVMFQLTEKWLMVSHEQSLPGLLMWYAINNPAAALDHSPSHMPREHYDWGMSSLIKRIQSRCCGLLEVRFSGKTLDGLSRIEVVGDDVSIDDIGGMSITYLHRTVHEFITIEEVWNDICRLTCDMSFSISTRLASACLSTIKLAKQITRLHAGHIIATTQLCREVADVSPDMAHSYLLALERAMSHLDTNIWPDQCEQSSIHSHWSLTLLQSPDAFFAPGVLSHASIYTYAAGQGILCRPMPFPIDTNQRFRFEIVVHALSSWMESTGRNGFSTPSINHKIRTLEYVLDRVMGPEGQLSDTTLWQIALVICEKLGHDSRHFEAAQLLKTTLRMAKSSTSLWNLPLRPSDSPASIWRKLGQPQDLGMVDVKSLLARLVYHLSRSGRSEDIHLVDEIERLTKANQKALHGVSTATQANEHLPNHRERGKKSRRSKKIKKRAGKVRLLEAPA